MKSALKHDGLVAMLAFLAANFAYFLMANDCNWETALMAAVASYGVVAGKAMDPRDPQYGVGAEPEDKNLV